ncbi:DUF6059 family protein [Micromonospora sp. NPDC126480]|uniref:DUF6059 family protein n=1 Tax=Micromonospora sp. NPDC126480 TaxID=3155312 RepID=UPI0033268604
MGWFRRVMSEVELGLSLLGASFAGIDLREILRSYGRGDPAPVAADGAADDPPPSGAQAPPPDAVPDGPPATETQPPAGHPERLVPHQPLTDEERRLWSQLR